MFLAVSSNQKLSEAVSTVPDQQLSVVQVPVSELGEVVISDDADHPSLSEVVMATGTDQSLCDSSISVVRRIYASVFCPTDGYG